MKSSDIAKGPGAANAQRAAEQAAAEVTQAQATEAERNAWLKRRTIYHLATGIPAFLAARAFGQTFRHIYDRKDQR